MGNGTEDRKVLSDTMAVIPLSDLLQRIFAEYRSEGSIFAIPEDSWYRPPAGRSLEIFGQGLETPLGPAAGPHTQLAVNIVAAYLSGSRFIELKTTQILDSLEIEKPCIDAADEGYNTEWSTELTLETAWQEYAKGWILLHVLEEVFELRATDLPRSFVFNLSVGYDLEGIKSPRMDQYISRLMDSSDELLFRRWLDELESGLPALLEDAGLESRIPSLRGISGRIPGTICSSVTLSTMHGCPPAEIEAISSYLLTERGLDCYVKLNPTLLGHDDVRDILNETGFSQVQLEPEGFAKDLRWTDALPMLRRLMDQARGAGRRFGVKLSNTLANRNIGSVLPGEERYLSGRALFPVTMELASRIAAAFDGHIPISYSGGISAWNVLDVFLTGIRPITLATDLLKPGGYLRQLDLLDRIDRGASAEHWHSGSGDGVSLDVQAITDLAAEARIRKEYREDFRSPDEVSTPGPLPLTDCYVAPCISACPIHQNVPEYIRLAGERRWDDALQCILLDNALPGITGAICDHECELHCTRLDYEGAVNIREVKQLVVRKAGADTLPTEFTAAESGSDGNPARRIAIIGAGPAGLSAAYFLLMKGISVELFEREASAGGVVRHIVPRFRISEETIAGDIRRIEAMGAKFHYGWTEQIDFDGFFSGGFAGVILALGTWQDRPMDLGSHMPVFGAYEFLSAFNRGEVLPGAGGRGVIIGAGDTAMDCARSALRIDGVESSQILYRRSRSQMPASREEYQLAREDGVEFAWLGSPVDSPAAGRLRVETMTLGAPDSSGRRRPVASGEFRELEADFCVSAVGDDPEYAILESLGLTEADNPRRLRVDEDGRSSIPGVYVIGDTRSGGTSIVKCIAAGRDIAGVISEAAASGAAVDTAVVTAAADMSGVANTGAVADDRLKVSASHEVSASPTEKQLAEIREKRGTIVPAANPRIPYDEAEFAGTELKRCLECSHVCNKCVDVCPNRANIPVSVDGAGFNNRWQIVHLDALCNECGNCGQFCPWDGRPYTDKPTVFSSMEAFAASGNSGWFVGGDRAVLRFQGAEEEFSPADVPGRPDGGAGGIAGRSAVGERADFDALFRELYRSRRELFAPADHRGEVMT